MRKWLGLFMVAVLLITAACSSNNGNNNNQEGAANNSVAANTAEPGKDADPVELTTFRRSTADIKFPEGQDYDNNEIKKAFEEAAGIKLTNKWIVDESQYVNKVNVSMASKDLADFFFVDVALLNTLVRSGQILALDELWDKQAGEALKQRLGADGGKQLDSARFNGKLMAIPQGGSPYDNGEVIWIRTDWLEKLGLQEPATMSELAEVARAFKEKDPDGNGQNDTYGMALSKKMFDGIYDLTGFMNGFHAYPRTWVKSGDGSLVYGSIQPEIKKGLQQLQDFFKDGLIDKEFGAKDEGKVNEHLINDKTGIAYGKWWVSNYPLNAAAVQNGKEVQKWKAIPIVSADDQPAKSQTNLGNGGYWVIAKSAKNPEAIMHMINTYIEVTNNEGKPEYEKYFTFPNGTNEQNANSWKLAPVIVFDQVGNAKAGKLIPEAIKSKDPSQLVGAQTKQYQQSLDYMNGNVNLWGVAKAWGIDGSTSILAQYVDNSQFLQDEFYGAPTPAMNSKLALLKSKEEEIYTKIIMNAAPVDEFDKFVDEFKKLGGDEMTKEVNDWYKSLQ